KYFVDLGCGDGIMVHLANGITGARALGIDRNPVVMWYARKLTPLLSAWGAVNAKRIQWVEGDYETEVVDLSQADVLYIWTTKLDLEMEEKLIRRMKPGAILVLRGKGIDHSRAERIHLGETAEGVFAGLPFTGYRRLPDLNSSHPTPSAP